MNQKILNLRKKHCSANSKNINTRIKAAEPIQQWIIDTVNHHGIPHEDQVLNKWERTDAHDDIKLKRDAVHKMSGKPIYAQIKYRMPDSGSDILYSLIQPYYDIRTLKECVAQEDMSMWARDYKFDGIYYISLNSAWDKLRVVNYRKHIKAKINSLLKEWVKSGEDLNYNNRVYQSSKYPGLQFRWTKDRGRGSFDSGVEKIICFLPETIFNSDQILTLDMIDPPDYLFK